MFLLSTLYPTFYCGNSRTKVRLFLCTGLLGEPRTHGVRGLFLCHNTAKQQKSELAATFQCTRKRYLVHKFQMAADRNAIGQTGGANLKR